MRTLLEIFQDTKETLCRYDYYIHTQKRILHLTNSEIKIPHLMGMQYPGMPNQFTGNFGAYAIKKQRITMESVEKLVRKYYKTEEKQRRMLGRGRKSCIWGLSDQRGAKTFTTAILL